jgi:DNA polymerase-4
MFTHRSDVTRPAGFGIRAIVHLDLDAFYAAVEVLENPDLTDQPVLIGGQPEERGVVAAASYPARAFGVRSAMPMSKALQRCPQAIVLPPRFDIYREYSRQVMAILRQTSSLVEQISIDEAYLDLTEQVTAWEDAVGVARTLQKRVGEEVGLSASLGVATNKLVAKVASDREKPGGLTVVHPGDEAAFLAPLPVRVLWGVGPRTAEKLAEMGATTVGELAKRSEGELRERFGQHGVAMANHARGIDRRPVVTEHERKSVSQERTFARDLKDAEALEKQLRRLSQRVAQQLVKAEVVAGTIAIKLRYSDFETLTRQTRLAVPTDDAEAIYQVARVLFHLVWQRGRPVRLLGVASRHLSPPPGQMPLL